MAGIGELVKRLGPDSIVAREAEGIRCEALLRTDSQTQVWVLRYYRPGYPPHDAIAFETEEDLIGYLDAAGMLEDWKVEQSRPVFDT
jgi:hypothetical protein